MKEGLSTLFLLLGATAIHSDESQKTPKPAKPSRDPSHLKLMVIHPHYRPAEPYTYPGPSPPVKMTRYPEPYNFMHPYRSPTPALMDSQPMPNWCKNMWERDECGMKCWMLRKICKNIAQQNIAASFSPSDEMRPDSEGSHSHPHYNMMPYGAYAIKPSVAYSKTAIPHTYYAQPSWSYSPIRRAPAYYHYHRPPTPLTNEIGLNPQFTYVDGNEQLKTKPAHNATESNSTATTTAKPETTTAGPAIITGKPARPKGTHAVKVVQVRYPEADVTTLSPMMFEYDQHGNKGYYGDRIYMSAVLPVSDRQLRRHMEASSSSATGFDSYEDFEDIFGSPVR